MDATDAPLEAEPNCPQCMSKMELVALIKPSNPLRINLAWLPTFAQIADTHPVNFLRRGAPLGHERCDAGNRRG
jgi:hypothetical protein